MKRPLIYFLGDETRCLSVMESFRGSVQSSFIKGRLTKLPKDKHPALICIISKPNANGNSILLSNVLNYSAAYRCPVFFIGSKHQYLTLLSRFSRTPVYKTNISNLYVAIHQLIHLYSELGNDELAMMKSRFRTVTLETHEASFAAYINGKINNCPRGDLRMVLTDDLSKIDSDNKSVAFITAENKNGRVDIRNLCGIKKRISEPLLIAAGLGEEPHLKPKVKYINLLDENSDIIKTIIKPSDKKLITPIK